MQAAKLRRYEHELDRLKAIHSIAVNCDRPVTEQYDSTQVHDDCILLMEETKMMAVETFDLIKQADNLLSPPPFPAPRARTGLLAHVQPVHCQWDEISQIDRAISNLRSMADWFSSCERDGSPDLVLSVYRGWRIAERNQRDSCFCVKASKTIRGTTRRTLSERIWRNADDPNKRVAMCTYYSRFSIVKNKKEPLDDSPCVFYSAELHEFPAPFQCRSFESIHGVHSESSEWLYVKHSIDGKKPEASSVLGAEMLGLIVQDTPRRDSVHVALVMLYDPQSVRHVKQVVCEEPHACRRVLSNWEENHGLLAAE